MQWHLYIKYAHFWNVKHILQLKSENIFPQRCLTMSSTWSAAQRARLLDESWCNLGFLQPTMIFSLRKKENCTQKHKYDFSFHWAWLYVNRGSEHQWLCVTRSALDTLLNFHLQMWRVEITPTVTIIFILASGTVSLFDVHINTAVPLVRNAAQTVTVVVLLQD